MVEDNTVRSAPTLLLSGRVGYQWSKGVRLALEGFNLLNRQDSQIAYYCESRLRGAAAGPGASGRPPPDIHFHPAEPGSFRLWLAADY